MVIWLILSSPNCSVCVRIRTCDVLLLGRTATVTPNMDGMAMAEMYFNDGDRRTNARVTRGCVFFFFFFFVSASGLLFYDKVLWLITMHEQDVWMPEYVARVWAVIVYFIYSLLESKKKISICHLCIRLRPVKPHGINTDTDVILR